MEEMLHQLGCTKLNWDIFIYFPYQRCRISFINSMDAIGSLNRVKMLTSLERSASFSIHVQTCKPSFWLMNVSLLLLWNFPAKPSHDLQGPWPKQGQYIIMVYSVNVTVHQLHIMEMQSPFTFLKRESFHTVCDIRGNW